MTDLSEQMSELWASLGPAPAGRARMVQFIGARGGQGSSTVAREFARFAAREIGQATWLMDMDLLGAAQHKAIAAEPGRYGALGPEAAASPDGSTFYTVQPPQIAPDGSAWPDARYLACHGLSGARMWVTRFRREALKPGQNVHVLPNGDYWTAMRRHADLLVVDAPAADRSGAGLTLARFMDDILLVVAADEADTQAPAVLRDQLAAAGGKVAGVVLNNAPPEPPRVIRDWLG